MPPRKYPSRRERQSIKDALPETYDDLMEAAVEAEEKGERFGSGPKAQRYFEASLDLYRRADQLSATFDSRYNIARVLYQLGTNFNIPPQAAGVLSSSIEAYRSAIAISEQSDLTSDAMFNLAQGLLDLAEMKEMFSIEGNVETTSSSLRFEAVQLLDAVLRFERESLRSEVATAEDPSLTSMNGVVDSPAEQDTTLVPEKHVPTKRSCLDTALLLADTQTDIWSDQTVPPAATDVQALSQLFEEAKSLAADAAEQIEVLIAEIDGELVLEALNWQLTANVNQCVQKLGDLLARLEHSPMSTFSSLPTKTQVDISVSRADLHGLLAARLLSLPVDQRDPATVWSHLSQAITLLTPSLQLPISPIDMPLAKPSLLLDLSLLSLRRAVLSEIGHEAALRSRSQLLANAEVYANKSLAAGGWGWLCSEAVDVGIVGATLTALPLAAGYIKEDLMERALATLIRGLLIRQQCDENESMRQASQNKLSLISSKITRMKATRGRHLDPKRLSKYVEEIHREHGQLWTNELQLWRLFAATITL